MKRQIAIALFVFLLAAPLNAQQGRSSYGDLQLTTPLRIAVSSDNNFLVDRTSPNERLFLLSLPPNVLPFSTETQPRRLADQVVTLTLPTLSLLNDSPRRLFSLSYQPEFEVYVRSRDQSSWNNKAEVDFAYGLTRRLQVYVADQYQSSKDPSRTLQNVYLLLPKSQFRQNALTASVDYVYSPVTQFSVRYDNTILTFGQTDPFQTQIVDSMTNGGSFSVTRRLRPNHRIRATYSMFTTKFLNSESVADERVDQDPPGFSYPVQGGNLEYRFSMNPRTVMQVSGGIMQTNDGPTYMLGALGDRRFGEIWVGGGYNRTLSFLTASTRTLANGLSPATVFDIVKLSVRGPVARNVGIQLYVTGSRGKSDVELNGSRSLLGLFRLDYRMSDRLVTYFSAETYRQNRNRFVNSALDRNRFSIGMEISLSSESDRRTSRLNRDAENVALTDYGLERVPGR
jgi:hypothetical protein